MIRKINILVVFLMCTTLGFSQSWRDTVLLGQQAYRTGDYQTALSHLIEGQKSAPETISLSNDIAQSAYRSKQFDLAKEAYKNGIEKAVTNTEKSDGFYNLGNVLFQEKNYGKAIQNYKQALLLNPNNEDARYNLVKAKKVLQKEQEQKRKNQKSEKQSSTNKHQEDVSSDPSPNNPNKENNTRDGDIAKGEENNSKIQRKLADEKVNQVLKELLEQEVNTKKHLQQQKKAAHNNQENSGKRW